MMQSPFVGGNKPVKTEIVVVFLLKRRACKLANCSQDLVLLQNLKLTQLHYGQEGKLFVIRTRSTSNYQQLALFSCYNS